MQELVFREGLPSLLQERLFDLLAWQVNRYQKDSSLPVETAQRLLDSLLFLLQTVVPEKERGRLLSEDLTELVREGEVLLRKKMIRAKRLWEEVCVTAPELENAFYRGTVSELGAFFSRYQFVFFAHEIPCSIDYPLLLPVSEKLQGISYVETYLSRLLTENRLIRTYGEDKIDRILTRTGLDYVNYRISLCEQALINSVGCVLCGKSALAVEALEKQKLTALLEKRSTQILFSAARSACEQLGLSIRYAAAVTSSLEPRIRAAYPELSNLFSFS